MIRVTMPGIVVPRSLDSDAWGFDNLCHALPFVAWRARGPFLLRASTRESSDGAAAGCVAAEPVVDASRYRTVARAPSRRSRRS